MDTSSALWIFLFVGVFGVAGQLLGKAGVRGIVSPIAVLYRNKSWFEAFCRSMIFYGLSLAVAGSSNNSLEFSMAGIGIFLASIAMEFIFWQRRRTIAKALESETN